MDTMSIEKDPHGMDPHAPGAKLDSGKIRPTLIFRDMAGALHEVARVATFGAKKYSDGGWLYVPNAYDRYTDAMFRHYEKEASGEEFDKDSGVLHQAHLAWNALARLELMLRKTGGAPVPAREPETVESPFNPIRNPCTEIPIPTYAPFTIKPNGVVEVHDTRLTMSPESHMEELVAFIRGDN